MKKYKNVTVTLPKETLPTIAGALEPKNPIPTKETSVYDDIQALRVKLMRIDRALVELGETIGNPGSLFLAS